MYDVNDDMDNVFRRAGENYPLRTNNADWSKISEALHGPKTAQIPGAKRRHIPFGRVAVLLLLMHIPFVCDLFWQRSTGKGDLANNSQEVVPPRKPISNDNNKKVNADRLAKSPIGRINFESSAAVPQQQIVIAAKKDTKQPNVETPNESNSVIASVDEQKTKPEALQTEASTPKKEVALSNPQKQPAEQVAQDVSGSESNNLKIGTGRNKRFYAGLVAGADVTTVKLEGVDEPGYDLGVIVGYQINDHWSVEAGALSTKKFYSTEAEYFNSSKIVLPPNTKITAVAGNCRMIELPVVVKYDFGSYKQKQWFATAGVSSYLMKKENYDYVYLYMNSNASAIHSYSYKNSSKDWLSILQLSGGFTYNFKKLANFRVEPYMQLPIRGVGYGDLRMTSFGLRMGINRKLF